MVSNMVKTAIVGSVGVAVIILSSTLGWILVPDIATSVLYNFCFLVLVVLYSNKFGSANVDFSLVNGKSRKL
jgi:hypothetical protein